MSDINPRQYYNPSGKPCSLDWLVKNEPEWAANQIRNRDKLDEENQLIKSAINSIKEELKEKFLRFEQFTFPHYNHRDDSNYGQALAYSHAIGIIDSHVIFKK